MKKLISILYLFIFTISISAVTKIGFYTERQTKKFILDSVKLYEKDMKRKYYKMQMLETIDQFNYKQIWEYKEGSSTVSATMSYHFYDDRVEVTMTNPLYITTLGTKSPLSSNDKMEFRRPLYEKLESMMFYVYFKYLMVNEKKIATDLTDTILNNNFSIITQNYLNSTKKEQAKQKFVDFLSNFTYSNMTVNYFYDKNTDSQEVHFLYLVSGVPYFITLIADYQFRPNDFTIKIKSIEKFNLITKKSDSSIKETDKIFIEMNKFRQDDAYSIIMQHADYISEP